MKILLRSSTTIFLAMLLICNLAIAGDFGPNHNKISDLEDQKINVNIPQEIKFLITFPDIASANDALPYAVKKGFKAIEIKNIGPDEKDLWVSKIVIPNDEKLNHIHKQLESIAKKFGGKYFPEEWALVQN